MMKIVCENHSYIEPIGILAWVLLEAWLGKTDKTKSGSTLELAISVIKKFFVKKPLKE